MYSNIIWARCSDVNFCPLYSSVRCLSPWLNLSTPTPDSCRIKPMAAEHDVSISRSFVFRLLRAKERERKEKKRLSQSNKKEEQWRHWIAKYQVRIPSSASLGLPSSVLLNYVLLTVSSRAANVVVFADKLSGSAWSNCLWLSWVSSSTMQGSVKAQQSNCQKYYDWNAVFIRLLWQPCTSWRAKPSVSVHSFEPSARAVLITVNCPAVSLLALTAPLDWGSQLGR